MQPLGYMVVVAAFLAGAFLSSLDPRLVDWGWFVPVVAVGAVGVLLLRWVAHQTASSDEVLANNRSHIEDSLARIVTGLDRLDAGKETLSGDELRARIDAEFRDDLGRFADARHSLGHMYGLDVYAEVMSAFAAGERYLNRVWSAAADGYLDEARAYVTRAHEQFVEARARLAAAHAAAES